MARKAETQGRFSLAGIKEALIFKALASGKLYQPLRSFFKDMELKWGDADTAYATLLEGRPVIVLGPTFFNEKVENEGEAAEVLLHEIMHHLFRHLELMPGFLERGFSQRTQNLAMDAVINAYLHSVGCAGFMKRFYPDEEEYAFLRPDSSEFMVVGSFGRKRPLEDVDRGKNWEFQNFYRSLYRLSVQLEESLQFFQQHFPEAKRNQLPLLGGHKPIGGTGKGREAGSGKTGSGTAAGGSGQGEGVFSAEEARQILEDLGLKRASKQAKDNFARVIAQITTTAREPGPVRTGTTQSKRIPAKLSRRDMLRVERGQDLFTRAEYRMREAWLFFDYSGSMDAYVRFAIDLAQSLGRSGIRVHPVIWADGIVEVPLAQFLRGEIPDVGGGTTGEVVAKYLNDHNIPQAAIITDNYAGEITTKVSARVYLCLVEGATTSGSFINPKVIPHCHVYELETGVR